MLHGLLSKKLHELSFDDGNGMSVLVVEKYDDGLERQPVTVPT